MAILIRLSLVAFFLACCSKLYLAVLNIGGKGKVATVTVFGGSGGVGQLISQSLRSSGSYNVNVVTRDVARTKEFATLKDCNIIAGDALDMASIAPTIKTSTDLVISVGTTAFPSSKWKNNNNPQRACVDTVENILSSAKAQKCKLNKVVLISSVGVQRTKEVNSIYPLYA
jgi:uncharacterized protein YbjT (DUF2867 family)